MFVKGFIKKYLEVFEIYFLEYDLVWWLLVEFVCKGYVGIMFLYCKGLNFIVSFFEIDVFIIMDNEGCIIIFELENCYII